MRDNLVLDIESQILLQFIVFFFNSTEAHILEDVNKCVQALQDKDPETVDRTAGQIRGRTARLEDVVTAEMENYQQGPYTDNVFRAVLIMHNEGIDYFLIIMQFHSITLNKQRDLSQKPLCLWTQITPNFFRCKHAFVTMALTTV